MQTEKNRQANIPTQMNLTFDITNVPYGIYPTILNNQINIVVHNRQPHAMLVAGIGMFVLFLIGIFVLVSLSSTASASSSTTLPLMLMGLVLYLVVCVPIIQYLWVEIALEITSKGVCIKEGIRALGWVRVHRFDRTTVRLIQQQHISTIHKGHISTHQRILVEANSRVIFGANCSVTRQLYLVEALQYFHYQVLSTGKINFKSS